MSKLTYSVERIDNQVYYWIFRDENTLTHNEVHWCSLPVYSALTCEEYSERALGRQLKLAHKLAKKGIKNMQKYELPRKKLI